MSTTPSTLITGGAGFIGSHLAREFLRRGSSVTILDNFSPQVHGDAADLAADLAPHVRLVRGDVRDPDAWRLALPHIQCVVHLAAETGTGQSMYDAHRYQQVNIGGTAHLYDLLAAAPNAHTVSRIVLASSRAVYGEGAYTCPVHTLVYPAPQSTSARLAGSFDPACPECFGRCAPAPTPESAPLRPLSFYGLTKQVQEQTALLFAAPLSLATVVCRLQNVYGPGQSLANPYTGVLALFATLARSGSPIELFEDGLATRDFLFVEDAARALADCVTAPLTGSHTVNIGSGRATTLLDAATAINACLGSRSPIKVSGRFRSGDVRHALADLALAERTLAFSPRTSFADGIPRLVEWVAAQPVPPPAAHDQALAELSRHGLLHG